MPRRPRPRLIQDVDHFQVCSEITARGATEKDVLQDPETGYRYIAKLGRRNNDLEVMTEYGIYLVGRSLGVPVADARVGRYRGRLRFMSRYFLDDERSQELVHGLQLFKDLYDEEAVKKVIGQSAREQEMFSVQSVKAAFGAVYAQYGPTIEEELFTGFVGMLAHDALIGVQDRHSENWGLIVERDIYQGARPRFAPLYDSARGLFCNESDDQLLARYTGSAGNERLDGFVGRSRPLIGFDGLRSGRRGYLSHSELIAAVYHAYPTQRRTIERTLAAYDWRAVRDAFCSELGGLCSPHRLDLILRCLRRRVRAVWREIHGREL